MSNQRHILIILDGYGIAEDPAVSAIARAKKPYLDRLFSEFPHSTLNASGLAVGLPEGQMGNSEVGHMNLGAGRVVYQELTRIDRAIEIGEFFENDVLLDAMAHVREKQSKLHLIGLFSDGGVHASNEHLFALLRMAAREKLEQGQVCVHAFTDGRDTDPHGGEKYAQTFLDRAEGIGLGRLVSLVGRYYAMDRDRRWDRIEMAYRLLVHGEGLKYNNPVDALEDSYEEGITDEFVKPRSVKYPEDPVFGKNKNGTRVEDGDAVIFFNFRADRARQLSRAFIEDGFEGFHREKMLDLHFVTFTPYEEDFDVPVAFPKVNLRRTIGEIVADHRLKQLRIAETEKYAHVTYFFSGGREEPFEGEDRILVPSPKVATYDLQPEMSAAEVAERAAEALATEQYSLVILNFANPDMVGHTGVLEAAVKAIEAVDRGTERVVEAARAHGYGITIIADHGNADRMKNPDGTPHTAHTTVPVPHLILSEGFTGPVQPGKLGDVAPTILRLMNLPIPEEMTGEVLVEQVAAS